MVFLFSGWPGGPYEKYSGHRGHAHLEESG